MYAYSNHGKSMRAVNADTPLNPGEITFPAMQTEAELAAIFPGYADQLAAVAKSSHNASIQRQLDDIDAKTVRPLRAVLAAQTSGSQADPGDIKRLAELTEQSNTLRAQLLK